MPDTEPFPDVLEDLRRLTRPRPGKRHPEIVVAGVLSQAEIETHPLVLEGEDGTTYELQLPDGWRLNAGLGDRVEVHGAVLEDVATAAQIGPLLRVRAMSSHGTSGDTAGEPPAEV